MGRRTSWVLVILVALGLVWAALMTRYEYHAAGEHKLWRVDRWTGETSYRLGGGSGWHGFMDRGQRANP